MDERQKKLTKNVRSSSSHVRIRNREGVIVLFPPKSAQNPLSLIHVPSPSHDSSGAEREELTSLHHQIAESYEQDTLPQFPGPGPFAPLPVRPFRYWEPLLMTWALPAGKL